MKSDKVPSFFRDKPLFGMDIGHGSIKVMQLEELPQKPPKKYTPEVIGYGFTNFDTSAQKDGVIVDPEVIAKAAHNLFANHLIGDITTRRVALAIPAYRTFTRSLILPKLTKKELIDAVKLEAEQYIPAPLDTLYLDYDVIKENETNQELLIVAVPRSIVDSYMQLASILGLEAVLIEPTLMSSARLLTLDHNSDLATFIIDFGSLSSDISIWDKQIMVTGTVQGGGASFTDLIKKSLKVSAQEAGLIKTRYGLGASKKQAEIKKALDPTLAQIVKEIRRMIRYYEERYGTDRPIGEVITLGGGANMPGLTDHMVNALRLPVRSVQPWTYLSNKELQPPSTADKPMYSTVAGLSLAKAKEVFIS